MPRKKFPPAPVARCYNASKGYIQSGPLPRSVACLTTDWQSRSVKPTVSGVHEPELPAVACVAKPHPSQPRVPPCSSELDSFANNLADLVFSIGERFLQVGDLVLEILRPRCLVECHGRASRGLVQSGRFLGVGEHWTQRAF